jgi:hypothetical protein
MTGERTNKQLSKREATPEERLLFEQLREFTDEIRAAERLHHQNFVTKLQSAEPYNGNWVTYVDDQVLAATQSVISDVQSILDREATSRLRKKRLKLSRNRGGRQATVLTVPEPPGSTLANIARVLLTAKAFERYVQPVIADAQYEHAEAMNAGHSLHARWIAIRMWLLVVPGWLWAAIGRLAKWWLSL